MFLQCLSELEVLPTDYEGYSSTHDSTDKSNLPSFNGPIRKNCFFLESDILSATFPRLESPAGLKSPSLVQYQLAPVSVVGFVLPSRVPSPLGACSFSDDSILPLP